LKLGSTCHAEYKTGLSRHPVPNVNLYKPLIEKKSKIEKLLEEAVAHEEASHVLLVVDDRHHDPRDGAPEEPNDERDHVLREREIPRGGVTVSNIEGCQATHELAQVRAKNLLPGGYLGFPISMHSCRAALPA